MLPVHQLVKCPHDPAYELCWESFAAKSAPCSCRHLFLGAAVRRRQRFGTNLYCTLATASPKPESEVDTRGNERYGLGKSLCVCVQWSLEAGTNSTNFKAVIPWECHWVCCCDLIQVFEKAVKVSDAIIFKPQLIYQ